jgi:DNA-binding NtrC family response regulator
MTRFGVALRKVESGDTQTIAAAVTASLVAGLGEHERRQSPHDADGSDDFAAVEELERALVAAADQEEAKAALSRWAVLHVGCGGIDFGVSVAPGGASRDLSAHQVLDKLERLRIPVDIGVPDRLCITLQPTDTLECRSHRRHSLMRVGARLFASRLVELSRPPVPKGPVAITSSVGASSLVGCALEALPKLAASNVTLLITGETGVGKTFLARHIHDRGQRSAAPFRVVNCGAIPEHLIESELFGHERGAFTGAVTSRVGVLEAAGNGTVLLDEIGELPLCSQVKLLRALEDRCFERVGSNRTIALQARIIAATNRDLDAMVEAGTFRGDLFFRISVVKLRVPALRERSDEIEQLAEQTLATLQTGQLRRSAGLSAEARAILRAYAWPGNIRELRNALEHALVFGDGEEIQVTHLPAAITASVHRPCPTHRTEESVSVALPAPLEWLEQCAIDAALRAAEGNKATAAQMLGIKPATLYYKLRKNGAMERR